MSSNYGSYVNANSQIVGGVLTGNPMMIASGIGDTMSFLSKLFGSGGASNASTRLNRSDTKWMYNQQSQQWRANTEWFNLNGYNQMKQGLLDAGYNPLMALGATPQQGATVTGSAMDSKSKSFNFDIPQAFATTEAMLRNTNADTMLKGAQTEENISRSNLENAEKALKDADLPYQDKKNAEAVRGMELQNDYIDSLTRQVEAVTGKVVEEKKLVQIQQGYYNSLTGLNRAQVKYYNSLIEKIDADIALTAPDREWLKNHPEQAEYLQFAKQYGGALSDVLTPVVQAIGLSAIGRSVNAMGKGQGVIQSPGPLIKVDPQVIKY